MSVDKLSWNRFTETLYLCVVSTVSYQMCKPHAFVYLLFPSYSPSLITASLHPLSSWFDASGCALLWFQSCLCSRSSSANVCSQTSQLLSISFGVNQTRATQGDRQSKARRPTEQGKETDRARQWDQQSKARRPTEQGNETDRARQEDWQSKAMRPTE